MTDLNASNLPTCPDCGTKPDPSGELSTSLTTIVPCSCGSHAWSIAQLRTIAADTTKVEFESAESLRSRGFDSGNYSAGYDPSDLDFISPDTDAATDHFRDGFLLGFFSSCELHEVPSSWRAAVETLRRTYPDN